MAFDQQREITPKDVLKVALHAILWLLCKSIMTTLPSKQADREPGNSALAIIERCKHQRQA